MKENISPARRLCYALRGTSHLMRKQIDKSEAKKYLDSLTGTRGYIICYLKENEKEDVFQKDIEKHFSLSRSTVTEVLQRMEKSGLISRLSVSSDARLKKIVLTEKAQGLIEILDRDRDNTDAVVVKNLSESEILTLIELLGKVNQNLAQNLAEVKTEK